MTLSPANFYDKHAETHDNKHTLENVPDSFLTLLDSFIAELDGRHVLDAGCGAGRDAKYFERNDLVVTGIDISPEMVARADQVHPGAFHVMDFTDLHFPDNTFHGIWCPASIFFVPPAEMETALSEFVRVLTRTGVARIGFKLGNGKYVNEKWGDSITEYHVPKETAVALLEATGFTVQSDQTNVFELGPHRTFANFLCTLG